jgi:hypothetical protein
MNDRSYNSVGAGAKPRLGSCYSVDIKSRPGGHQSGDKVNAAVDIPKVARPGGAQGGGLKSPGTPPKAARPGGAQGL